MDIYILYMTTFTGTCDSLQLLFNEIPGQNQHRFVPNEVTGWILMRKFLTTILVRYFCKAESCVSCLLLPTGTRAVQVSKAAPQGIKSYR